MDDHFDICCVFEISKFDIARLTCTYSYLQPQKMQCKRYIVNVPECLNNLKIANKKFLEVSSFACNLVEMNR